METKKPGKQGTKGTKQIVEENKFTLQFYLKMIVGGSGAYFGLQLILGVLFGGGSFGWGTFTLAILSVAAQVGAFKFMQMMARPNIAESGQIIDSGSDLCMEGGIGEHVKDIIILCVATQVLSLVWSWFWLALLLAPARAFHLAWGSVIRPWLQSKNEKPEVDEKKQKKMERKMKRRQY